MAGAALARRARHVRARLPALVRPAAYAGIPCSLRGLGVAQSSAVVSALGARLGPYDGSAGAHAGSASDRRSFDAAPRCPRGHRLGSESTHLLVDHADAVSPRAVLLTFRRI